MNISKKSLQSLLREAFMIGCEMEKAVRQENAIEEEERAFEVYKLLHEDIFPNEFTEEEKDSIKELWNSHEYEVIE